MEKAKINSTIVSVLTILLGLALIFRPGTALVVVIRLIGAVLLIGGCLTLYNHLTASLKGVANTAAITLAIIAVVVGLFLLFDSYGVIGFFPCITGLLIMASGIINLVRAVSMKGNGYERWMLPAGMACLTILFGAIIFANPFSTMRLIVMAVGAIFIYNGVINLFIGIRYYH